ncbi:MAG: hypothetical protein LBD51_04070 [Bifidobacteriaceae bacterium]|jgi:hypothetical protein|nr:hypothetical protein [Bifidobacteriaceae bacterium]
MGQDKLASAARRLACLATCGALGLIAATVLVLPLALSLGESGAAPSYPWGWWLLAGGAGAGGIGLWRLGGQRALRAWRSLGAPAWAVPASLFAFFLAVKLVPALALKTAQRSDFLMIYQAAQSIAAGDHSFNTSAYWHFFAYQTPFALWEAALVKLGGGSLVPLLAANALAMAGTNLLVFLAARRLSGSAVGGIAASLAYCAYPGPYLLANVLTNDHLSTFLLYLGAFMVLAACARAARGGQGGWRAAAPGVAQGLAGGLVLQLGNLIRPAGPLVWLALAGGIGLGLATGWRGRQGRRGRRGWRGRRPGLAAGAAAGAALAAYALLALGAGAAVKASGVNPGGVASNLPEWKFICALAGPDQLRDDAAAIGAYAAQPKAEARAAARDILARDLRQLPQTWRYILGRQLRHLWVENDTALFAFNPALAGNPTYSLPDAKTATAAYLMVGLERGIFLPAVVLAAWGAAAIGRRRRWGALAAFLGCLVAAYFLAHLVIEAQPRYRYLVSPAIFALAGPAWARLATPARQLGRAVRGAIRGTRCARPAQSGTSSESSRSGRRGIGPSGPATRGRPPG